MHLNQKCSSSRQRIARARTHVRNLNRVVKGFIRRKPYKHVVEPHDDGIHETHKLKARRRNLPRSFADVSTDAIENLRAALDQAVYAIAIAHGITNPDVLKKVAFPFSSNDTKFKKRLKDACPDFPKTILVLLESFKPYKGGNNTLWTINELANISKHKTLTTVAFNIIAGDLYEISGMRNMVIPPQWDRSHNEFVLGTTESAAKVMYKVRFEFNIGFDGIPVLAGKDIIGALTDMTSKVDRVVTGIEAEGRRIGLFT